MNFHSWMIMFIWLTAFAPFITLEIIFLYVCIIYLLIKNKRISVKFVLIVTLGSFLINLIPVRGFFQTEWNSLGVLVALLQLPYGLIEFFLLWGIVCMARKFMNKKNFSSKWKKVVYIVIFVICFFVYYPFTYWLYSITGGVFSSIFKLFI